LKTALITGASGFCARYLANRLSGEGGTLVIGADLAPPPDDGCVLDDFARLELGDFGQVVDLLRRLRPDLVFHLAGIQHGEAKDIYMTNAMGSVHLLEAVRQECHSARVLLVGSAAEYGPVEKKDLPVTESTPCSPHGPYGLSKYASTLAGLNWSRQFGMKVVIARPFNIIGAGISPNLFVGALLARAREALSTSGDPVVKVGNLESQRDFIAVEDVVEAYTLMLEGDYWGEIINICSGRPLKIISLADMLLAHSSRPIRLEVDPGLVRGDEVNVMYGNGGKARRLFGFQPRVSVEESLSRIWREGMESAG